MEEQQGKEGANLPEILVVADSLVAGDPSEIAASDGYSDMASPPSLTRWYAPENVEEERNKRGKEMIVSVLATALDLAKAACSRDEQKEPPEKVLPYYEQAIHAMDMALDLIPDKMVERTQLQKRRDDYQSRMKQLKVACIKPDKGEKRRKDHNHQSRVAFIEQTGLDSNYKMEVSPQSINHRPYWIMRLIRQTIEEGGYLSPRLFVPKGVWTQAGAKFPGFTLRLQAMESLLYMIMDKIMILPKLEDAETRVNNLKAIREFREGVQKLQNDLSRPFPFIPEIDTRNFASTEPGNLKKKDISLPAQKGNLSKFNSLMKNLGRNVKNTASIAYERFGASVTSRVIDNELVYYAQLISEVCRLCQIFDEWLVLVELENELPYDEENLGNAEFLEELVYISMFMRSTTCELIVRDVEILLERYLRKMCKSYVRIYWDTEDA